MEVATVAKLGTKLANPRNKEMGNMRRKALFSILFLVAIVLAGGGIVHAACPQTLTALPMWYETDPPFSAVSQIDLIVVLRNASGSAFNFSTVGSATFQLWSVPSVITPVPVTINSAPSGTVAENETFTYDLTIDTSALPLTENRLGFRPQSIELGTMQPSKVPLVNASISCIGAPPPIGGTTYPENTLTILAPWIAVGAVIVAAATVFTRRRRAHS
jgi:hypothetical protein